METATLDILQVSPISSTSQTSQALKTEAEGDLLQAAGEWAPLGWAWGNHSFQMMHLEKEMCS